TVLLVEARRRPWDHRPGEVAVAVAVELVEREAKFAYVGPDAAPLLRPQRVAAGHERRARAERDHVLGEQRLGRLVVDALDALLQGAEPAADGVGEVGAHRPCARRMDR